MFHFTPTITTAEMRTKTGNDKFDYILLCNKICGNSHYNMQMTIIVETQEEYNKWLSEKKPFGAAATATAEVK
jgi:cytochrome c oxidase subunit 2